MPERSRRPRRSGFLTRLIATHYLRKPELESLVAIKHPTWVSRFHAALNELAFRRKSLRSHRLTAANVELTNRCNLACVMCPVNRDMSRKKRDLEWKSFQRIVDETPSLELILMFQWGESLLVPDLFDRVRYAVSRGIRVMMTSNGTLVDDEACRQIIDCGLERITFSVDGTEETHHAIRGFALSELEERVARLVALRDEVASPLGVDVNMTVWEENEADVSAVRRRWQSLVDRVQLIPRFTDGRRRSPCRELWRGGLVVLSNGVVAPCCRDSEGELAVGHIDDATLVEIFNGPKMSQLRDSHRRGEFPPLCARCAEFETPEVHPRFS